MASKHPSTWAHPRSRGENGEADREARGGPGSSPLTRGKRPHVHVRVLDHGLIPAHAGKTSLSSSRRCINEAHPRSRGENGDRLLKGFGFFGSSPLTRGKLRQLGGRHVGGRLIPAHAGKTSIPANFKVSAKAHPRSRGENDPLTARLLAQMGSSPLTRGKREGLARGAQRNRLIPAHAGKTTWRLKNSCSITAHPRSRGENTLLCKRVVRQKGSSPLTRGKLPSPHVPLPPVGLIPAHAGKTRWACTSWSRFPAHPRSRGENPARSFVR